jgi:threonine synthase
MDSELPASVCRRCGDLLEIILSRRMTRRSLFDRKGPGIWRFAEALPLQSDVAPVSLGEGHTPLVRVSRIRAASHLSNLFVKNDGQNPTGSFKDRGMAVAVTRAKALKAKALVCASTGNTAASLAAYGARAGMHVVVVVPRGGVASGKLGQAFSYGARVFGVEGSFDEALELVFELVRQDNRFYLMNSINPFRIEGQKVAAFEIYERLGGVPDYVILPVGNAGNISAIWKGFKELRAHGIARSLPRMIGVQAEGAAPIAEAFVSGRQLRPWRVPQTVASAIKIGKPVSWKKALAAIEESGGAALTVSDREILAARTELATKEGLLVEAASAAPVAALAKLNLPRNAKVVCIATGSGLKDVADHKIRMEIEGVNDANAISAALGTRR